MTNLPKLWARPEDGHNSQLRNISGAITGVCAMLDLQGWWQSLGDRRKDWRRSVHEYAFVDLEDGSAPQACVITDLSRGGARLTVVSCSDLPDEFTLLVPRRCHVVRRTAGQVGVRFVEPATTDCS